MDIQTGRFIVEQTYPAVKIGKTDSAVFTGIFLQIKVCVQFIELFGGNAASVIPHSDDNIGVIILGSNIDMNPICIAGLPMYDRIFYQGLDADFGNQRQLVRKTEAT